MMINKAKFSDCEDGKPTMSHVFYAQFNPNELTINEALPKYTDAGEIEKLNDDKMLTLSMKLFYNTFYSLSQSKFEDVRNSIRAFYPYTNLKTEKKENLKKIAFAWGSISICGILTKLDVQYTMFSPTGIPVRAEASITIEGNYYGESITEAKFKAQGKSKEHQTFKDMVKSYKDPQLWKEEARKSGVKKART